MAAAIEIDNLLQYKFEAPTDSLKIYISSRNGGSVAKIENGVTFTPKRGVMNVSANATNMIV